MKFIKPKVIVILLLIVFFSFLLIFGQRNIFEGATTATPDATATATPQAKGPTYCTPTTNTIQSPNTYFINIYYYIKDNTTGPAAMPIAYVEHNLSSKFNVYFSNQKSYLKEPTKCARGADNTNDYVFGKGPATSIYIENSGVTNSQDLMPVSITKTAAVGSSTTRTNLNNPISETWTKAKTWKTSGITSFTINSSTIFPVFTGVKSGTPPPTKATDCDIPVIPDKTTKDLKIDSSKGNIFMFDANYSSLASSDALSPGTNDKGLVMLLATINVTFKPEIC